jgi:hypothetical protein
MSADLLIAHGVSAVRRDELAAGYRPQLTRQHLPDRLCLSRYFEAHARHATGVEQ